MIPSFSSPFSNTGFDLYSRYYKGSPIEDLRDWLDVLITGDSRQKVLKSEICEGLFQKRVFEPNCAKELVSRIVTRIKNEFDPEDANSILTNWNDSDRKKVFFPDALLVFIEGMKRQGASEDLVESLQYNCLLLKLSFFFETFTEEAFSRQDLEKCLQIIENTIERIEFLSTWTPEIPLKSLEVLLKKTVPYQIDLIDLKDLLISLKNDIVEDFFCLKFIFGSIIKFEIIINDFDELTILMYQTDSAIFLIGCLGEFLAHRNLKMGSQVKLICIPKESPEKFELSTCKIQLQSKDNVGEFIERVDALKKILDRNPNANSAFLEPSIFDLGDVSLLVQPIGYRFLKSNDSRALKVLSMSDILEIFEDVLDGIKILEDQNVPSLQIRSENISFKKEEDGRVHGKLDFFGCTPSKIDPLDSLMIDSIVPDFRPARFSWIIAFSEIFSLDFKCLRNDFKIESWEECFLENLRNQVFDKHFQKVLELKKKHETYNSSFAQDLLGYIQEIRENEDNAQCGLLTEFAVKTAIFPYIKDLLLQTLNIHQQINIKTQEGTEINQEIPSWEEIKNVLQKMKREIEILSNPKVPTELKTIVNPVGLLEILENVFPEKTEEEKHLLASSLLEIVNDIIEETPEVGTEIRLHKNTRRKDKLVALSMWVQVEKNFLRLQIILPTVLGLGGYRKIKGGEEFILCQDGAVLSHEPIAIARLKVEPLDEGRKIHERILNIPGSRNYFFGFFKSHKIYSINERFKQEEIRPRFETLSDVLKKEEGSERAPVGNLIQWLLHLGNGISLIAKSGISHGDMNLRNIALIGEKGEKVPLLFDFDMASGYGIHGIKSSFWLWNAIRNRFGFVSSETDRYSYVITIAQTLLPQFSQFCVFGRTTSQSLKQFQSMLDSPILFKQKMLETYASKICEKFPDIDLSLLIGARGKDKDSYESVFNEILKFKTLEREKEVQILQEFISLNICFDDVFTLVLNTLRSDKKSLDYMPKQSGEITLEIVENAMKESKFPTMEEIQKVLSDCFLAVEQVGQKISSL